MLIEVENYNDSTVVVSLSGRMDAMTTVEFDRWFKEEFTAGKTGFVIDLQKIDYISSAGLRSFLAAAKQLKTKNGSLVVCCLGGSVKEVFRISGFTGIIPSFQSVDEACAAL